MGSICPRSFLFVIIQGIYLVYSPQEPVAVALDLPAKSLDSQSVGTKQQLGLSHSCQLNRGAGWIVAGFAAYIWWIWSSVTLDTNSIFFCFVSLLQAYLFTRNAQEQIHWKVADIKCCFLGSFKSIRLSWEIWSTQCLIHYFSKNKQMMDCSKMFQAYL